MELPPQPQTQHHPPSPPSENGAGFFHSSQPYGLFYDASESNNPNSIPMFPPQFPLMPLRSDGSLCIMEALSRTHSPAMAPKLEDFFSNGATMGTQHYDSNERGAMALSLDSIYYHQNQDQQIQAQPQHYQQFPGFRNHEILLDSHVTNCSDAMKNWVSRNFQNDHAMHQKNMVENGGESGSIRAIGYGNLQSLSLSMSPDSQSSCVTGSQQISPTGTEISAMETKKRGLEKVEQKQIVHRKSIDTFGQRTSQYRGVTRHRWTGRYEAHLWDNSCKKEGQSRKGRQVYLGGYDMEEKAARAYDLAALKYWGPSTHINFPVENYQKELEEMKNMSRQEYVAHLRRKSSGFSRGASIYRGVTRHHQHGRWQARIGRVAGNKDLYLGTFSTQEEAAEAYDVAAIKFRGINAVTNFDITRYDVERIMASNTLLAGELARRNKEIGPGNDITSHNAEIHTSNVESIVSSPKTQPFTLASNNVGGIDTTNSLVLQEARDYAKIGAGAHISNASSLATSLGSSRDGSPERTSVAMPFPMVPSAQIRQMPVFAAWTDV